MLLNQTVALSLLLLPGFALASPPTPETLQDIGPGLSQAVAHRAVDALYCAEEHGQEVDKLIVVDMSLKSTTKRLWAFDLAGRKPRLVVNELVAHGSGSDKDNDGYAERFSNTPDSNMTSLGLYAIGEKYQGKHGWSRRLDGLFKLFNSKARQRDVVLHSSDYVNPAHVGRSQGCPAIKPATMTALEKAGLKNAVLWIDGPNADLARTVADCASRYKTRHWHDMPEPWAGLANPSSAITTVLWTSKQNEQSDWQGG